MAAIVLKLKLKLKLLDCIYLLFLFIIFHFTSCLFRGVSFHVGVKQNQSKLLKKFTITLIKGMFKIVFLYIFNANSRLRVFLYKTLFIVLHILLLLLQDKRINPIQNQDPRSDKTINYLNTQNMQEFIRSRKLNQRILIPAEKVEFELK